MTDWKVRIPGRHAVGPVSTELLVRGIRAGRIPADAEVVEVGSDAWTPLASVDEFYEAMGLSDMRTAVLDPVVDSGTPFGGDGDDDTETGLVTREPRAVDIDEQAVTRLIGQPAEPRTARAAKGAPRATDSSRSPESLRRVFARGANSTGQASRPYGVPEWTRSSASAGSGTMKRQAPPPARDTATRRRQPTLPGIAPPPAPPESSRTRSTLLDADEADEDSGAGNLYSKAHERFPGIRPLIQSTALGMPGPETLARLGTPQAVRIDRTDEATAPAVRLQRAYARTRAALVVLLALLSVALMALVALWVRR